MCFQVRFTATRATVAFILANESDNAILIHFKDLLPLMIQVRYYNFLVSISALTLLVGRQVVHLACKKLSVGCWRGCLG